MADAGGTLQTLLGWVSSALEPLERDMVPGGRARAVFFELGIEVTGAQEAALATPIQALSSGTEDLLQLSGELVSAIEDDNTDEILAKAAGAIENIIKVVQAIVDLKNAIDALGGVPPEVVEKVPERLFNLLLVRYLEPLRGVNELLELFGVLEREWFNVDPDDPEAVSFAISTFRFDRIGAWFQSPGDVMRELYGWNDPAFDGVLLLRRIGGFLSRLNAPVFLDEESDPPRLDLVLFDLSPKTDIDPKGLGLTVRTSLSTGLIEFADDAWKIQLKLDLELPFTTGILVQPEGRFSFIPPSDHGEIGGGIELKFLVDRTEAEEKIILLGDPGGSRLEIGKVEVGASGEFEWDAGSGQASGDFSIGGAVAGGKLLVSFENVDGFIGEVLGGVRLESDFDFGLGFSTKEGLYFIGSTSLEIQIPLHLSLGPIEISSLTFSLGIRQDSLPLGVGADIRALLGPLNAVVENIGLEALLNFKNDQSGNLGAVDFSLGFKPPRGVGLSLDTGIVVGGGYLFFDTENEEYAGALELSIAGIVTVKAIGLITTKLPDGSKGFSLLIIISAEFTPIQLGFGLTLNGVGGLLGLNRTVVLQALRDGVRTGAINSVLFPTNIVANAPRIISDLKAIFPPFNDRFLIGPMAKFGWGTPTLISLSFGLVIEIPGNIAILGVLGVALPDEQAALIVLKVAFVGTLDFDRKMLTFDASLFDSRVLFITLEGDMALRLSWGDNPAFLLSVGGFHPAFTPPPLDLPTLRRISASILNEDWARVRIEAYFAVTSNTVQFGARLELFFGFDALNVSGHLGLDALFQFSPFYFIVEISGSLAVKVFGFDLLSVRLLLSLSGPTPWRAMGHGVIGILFFEIDVSFDVTWGDEADTTLPPIEVWPLITGELEKTDNWKVLLPPSSELLVSSRKIESEGEAPELMVHPTGTLRVSQHALPLAFDLDKVGSKAPSDVNRIDVIAATSGGVALELLPVEEQFAPAQFEAMQDSEKLSRASFEKMKGGVALSLGAVGLTTGKAVRKLIEYELTIIDKEARKPLPVGQFVVMIIGLFLSMLRGGAAARSTLSNKTRKERVPFENKVEVPSEGFAVVTTLDGKLFAKDTLFASEALALAFLRQKNAENPRLREVLQVVPTFEVNES